LSRYRIERTSTKTRTGTPDWIEARDFTIGSCFVKREFKLSGGISYIRSRPPFQGKLKISLPFGLVPAEATTGKLERTEPQETVEQIAAHQAECDRDRLDRGHARLGPVSNTFRPKSNRNSRPPFRIAIG
jgi:hypothetical protein